MGNKNKSIYPDRLCSKCIPVAGILLVPHLQCADGYADE